MALLFDFDLDLVKENPGFFNPKSSIHVVESFSKSFSTFSIITVDVWFGNSKVSFSMSISPIKSRKVTQIFS